MVLKEWQLLCRSDFRVGRTGWLCGVSYLRYMIMKKKRLFDKSTHVSLALKFQPNYTKALYRRAVAYEAQDTWNSLALAQKG
jgi:hypothetical protein